MNACKPLATGVWAVGDCAGSPHFTHISFDDFRIVRDNITGGHKVTTGRQVPFCMFTDPEFARIGLSETEAKAQGVEYRLAKIPMVAVLRTRTLSETRGFMKALIDTKSDRILGFTAFGVEAGEVIASVQVAMLAGLPYTVLRDAILTHPTMLEGLIPLFSAVPPISIRIEVPSVIWRDRGRPRPHISRGRSSIPRGCLDRICCSTLRRERQEVVGDE